MSTTWKLFIAGLIILSVVVVLAVTAKPYSVSGDYCTGFTGGLTQWDECNRQGTGVTPLPGDQPMIYAAFIEIVPDTMTGAKSGRMGHIIHPPIHSGGAPPCASNSNLSCAAMTAVKKP